jgi:hypothetical protein
LGDWDQEDQSSRPTWANSLQDPIYKNKPEQVAECLLSIVKPQFKPYYHKKKKKKKSQTLWDSIPDTLKQMRDSFVKGSTAIYSKIFIKNYYMY